VEKDGTLAKWCVCFVHGTLAKWCICLCAVLNAGFGGRGVQYLVQLVEGCSIGTVLNAGFGGSVQYRFSTDCRVWWKRSAVLNAGPVEEYCHSTECRVQWKWGEVLKGLVEWGHSIGAVLNSGFGGRGAQYRHSTECRVWWKRHAVLAQY
jgi:hypothetical protein